jgi:hypothetical protein
MNCLACLGRLWIQDVNGDFFKCLTCNATGEHTDDMATIADIATARRLRDVRNSKKMVFNDPDGDAA